MVRDKAFVCDVITKITDVWRARHIYINLSPTFQADHEIIGLMLTKGVNVDDIVRYMPQEIRVKPDIISLLMQNSMDVSQLIKLLPPDVAEFIKSAMK